jgi:hypothetical protein
MNDNLSMNNTLVSVKEGFNRGNMFDNLFMPYKYIADIKPIDRRNKLMMDIQMFCFAAHELNLYLDLYPDDIQAIGLYNQYKEEANRLTYEYEKEFGKIELNINESYTWDWVKSPWPWERI